MRTGRLAMAVWLMLLAIGAGVMVAAEGAGAAQGPATGLAVQPGGLLIQGIEPGQRYDLKERSGVALTVFNRDRRDHVYALSTHRPSEAGNRRVPPGYSDIPDPSWFWFEKAEVSVPGQGSAEMRMYLQVPAYERYHNQHWSVSIGVVGKPQAGETLALAVYPRFEIETTPATRRELRSAPAGEIVLSPSVITFSGMAGGERRECELVLRNNDARAHRYEFTVLPDGQVGDRRIFGTGGFAWVTDAEWVKPRFASVWVGKRRSVCMPVRAKLPEGAVVPQGGWETILLVKRDDGVAGFARVLVRRAETREGGGAG